MNKKNKKPKQTKPRANLHSNNINSVDSLFAHRNSTTKKKSKNTEQEDPLLPSQEALGSGERKGLTLLSKVAWISPSSQENSCWKTASSTHSLRIEMQQHIVQLLKASKPNAPKSVLEKLPSLALRMEQYLFKVATSCESYVDQSTLKQRLGQIQQHNTKALLRRASPRFVDRLSSVDAKILYDSLQVWRQRLVTQQGVVPWDILSNDVLAQVAKFGPTTEKELELCGVDKYQIKDFGLDLLMEIKVIIQGKCFQSEKRNSVLGKRGNEEGEITQKRTKPNNSDSPRSPTASSGVLHLNSTSNDSNANPPVSLPIASKLPGIFSSLPPVKENRSPSSTAPFQYLPAPTTMALPTPPNTYQISSQYDHRKDASYFYEHEIQSLRLLLQQSQHENSRLQSEIHFLRSQLRIQSTNVNIMPAHDTRK